MNKKSKSEFIVENRFKISIILVIVFSLIGILRNYLKEGITILNVINKWVVKIDNLFRCYINRKYYYELHYIVFNFNNL